VCVCFVNMSVHLSDVECDHGLCVCMYVSVHLSDVSSLTIAVERDHGLCVCMCMSVYLSLNVIMVCECVFCVYVCPSV